MKTLFPIVVTLLVLAISGCAPQVDVEADTAAVKKWFDESTAALNANDGSIVDFNTKDAVMMFPDEPAVVGKEAISERNVKVFIGQFTSEEIRSVDEVVVAGDWAFVRWAGTGTMTPKDGSEPSVFDRKGIALLQRQPDNSWKYARVIWNSNQPPASE